MYLTSLDAKAKECNMLNGMATISRRVEDLRRRPHYCSRTSLNSGNDERLSFPQYFDVHIRMWDYRPNTNTVSDDTCSQLPASLDRNELIPTCVTPSSGYRVPIGMPCTMMW